MTDLPGPSPSTTRPAAGLPSATKAPSRRRSRPAAASRILVTGLSVAATLGLATAMATPEIPDGAPFAEQGPVAGIGVPSTVSVTATDQPAVTASHAS